LSTPPEAAAAQSPPVPLAQEPTAPQALNVGSAAVAPFSTSRFSPSVSVGPSGTEGPSLSLGPSVAVAPAGIAPRQERSLPLPEPIWRALARHDLLLPLLRQTVVAKAVAEVPISEQDSMESRRAWGAAHRLDSPEAVKAYLLRRGMVEADAIWQAELPRRIALHCEAHFSARAEQRFLARKNQLDQVIYSLLRIEEDGPLAQELYLRIAEGEADFAELAARYSMGPERSTRGVVGPVPLLQAHPTLAELLRTSRPGQLHPPLRIEQWWLVVRLESLRSATFDPDMRQRMSRELFEEWVEEEVATLLSAASPSA